MSSNFPKNPALKNFFKNFDLKEFSCNSSLRIIKNAPSFRLMIYISELKITFLKKHYKIKKEFFFNEVWATIL